ELGGIGAQDERLDPLHADAVAGGEAEEDGAIALELRARLDEHDAEELAVAVVAQQVRLRRSLLAPPRPRALERRVRDVAGRVVGDVAELVRAGVQAHPVTDSSPKRSAERRKRRPGGRLFAWD